MTFLTKRYLPGKKLHNTHSDPLVKIDATPSQRDQVRDDLLKLQKEFACEIYIQKDKEHDL
jgi:hypothetical protein